ncbi:MAG: sodium:solute symporter family protein [Rickettsiales bacterium]|nr:MAG: sodium:solute symporter family protein [Rickettsiales bacterium]
MIDIIIVCAYLLLLPIIAVFKKRSSNNFDSFSKITEKLKGNKLILIATIFASSIGGGTTFGIAEKAFSENIAHSYGLMLAIPVDIMIAIFVLPKLIKHYGSESVGDIMYTYYGNAGRYIGGLSSILVSTGLLAAQISVSGRIFEYILQIDYLLGVVLSYSIVVIYTTIGGLQSILFTNLLQFFAIIIAIPIISFFGLYQIGVENFINIIPMQKVSFTNNPDLLYTTISATLGFMVINLLPTFIQRALINKNTQTTRSAIYTKSIIYFIFLIFITLNGLIAFIKYPEIKASLALPYLIDHIIPTGIQGIVVVGLLAAVMSTADSDLNILSITIVKDFFNPIFSIINQKKMLILVRLTNIIVGSFAIILALSFNRVVDLVIFVAGFWGPVVLIPLLFGLYEITISKIGFILVSICGASSFIIWSHYFETITSLKGVFVGTAANLALFTFFIFIKKGNIRSSC